MLVACNRQCGADAVVFVGRALCCSHHCDVADDAGRVIIMHYADNVQVRLHA